MDDFTKLMKGVVLHEYDSPGKALASDEDEYVEEDFCTNSDGQLVYPCTVCGDWSPIGCEPEEFDDDMHYCGGSPSCCP